MSTNSNAVTKLNAVSQMANTVLALGSKPLSDLVGDAVDVYAITSDEKAQLSEIVKSFIDGESDIYKGQSKLRQSASVMAEMIGNDCSFVKWEGLRKDWVALYMRHNQKANESSSEKAWQRLAKVMLQEFEVVKPKAESSKAKQMAEKREAERKYYSSMPDSVLVDKMTECVSKFDFDGAKKFQAEVKRRQADANKGSELAIKEKREQVIKAVRGCNNLSTLQEVLSMLQK